MIEPNIALRARRELAGRSLRMLTSAPVDIVQFELDQDLDLYTDLVFAGDVTMAAFGDIRIYRGAALVFDSPTFILRAASAKGDLLAVTGETAAGISLNDHILQV